MQNQNDYQNKKSSTCKPKTKKKIVFKINQYISIQKVGLNGLQTKKRENTMKQKIQILKRLEKKMKK